VTRIALVLAMLCAGCGPTDRHGTLGQSMTTITVDGSGALLPLLLEAGNQFMRQTPRTVVMASAGREREAVQDVLAGKLTMAATNLPITERSDELEVRDVCQSALAIVSNRGPFNQRVVSLSRAQLAAVFQGRIDNWKALGGDDQRITVFDRRASGDHVALARWLDVPDFAPPDAEDGRAATVQSDLTSRLGALSFVALPYRHPELKTIAIDGVEASVDTVRHGTYPLRTRERIVVRKDAPPAVRAFADFLVSSAVRDDLLEQLGYAPP
jgi:phosphate transport system substrate-binding protein